MKDPVNSFLSNQKEGTLKSILVDVALFSTEIVNDNSKIEISPVVVADLTEDIHFIIPLFSELGTGVNRTLGCGYLDVTDSIFKNEGIKT